MDALEKKDKMSKKKKQKAQRGKKLLDCVNNKNWKMTITDIGKGHTFGHMAKRQKTGPSDTGAIGQEEEKGLGEYKPSDEMLGLIIAATRTPDMNIVEFSGISPDEEITPEPVPLSDSELPPRPERQKKKEKKHKSKSKQPPDNVKHDDKDTQESSSKSSCS